MKKKICVLVVAVLMMVGSFSTVCSARERMPINDIVLSEDTTVPMEPRDMLIALLEVNIQKCEVLELPDFCYHNQQLLEEVENNLDYPAEQILEDMRKITDRCSCGRKWSWRHILF